MLFDSHIHLDRLGNLQPEIDAARAAGINSFLVPGVHPDTWPQVMQIAETVQGAFAAPGVHPLAAIAWNRETQRQLQACLDQPGAVAIGEIGLDSHVDVPLDVQETVFREQLRLALDRQLPVILHCRGATGRLLNILREEQAGAVGGILHAFSGSLETAREAIRLGFALAIGGPVTYPESKRIPGVARQLPEDWLVLETDAPDLAPHPHRGEQNRPVWLKYVQQRLAELRGWTLEETATITTRNARRVLHLKEDTP